MQLNTIVLKILRRTLNKGEIAYETVEIEDGQHQATVRLPELPSVGILEFNGHPLGSAIEAENSAAEMAVQAIQEDPELQQMAAAIPQKKKSSGGAAPGAALAASPLSPLLPAKGCGKGCKGFKGKIMGGNNVTMPAMKRAKVEPIFFGAPVPSTPRPEVGGKMQLNTIVLKILRRPINKGEIAYETVEVEDGQHQATVRLPELPHVGVMEFNGHTLGSDKEAENSAAEIAVQAIQADPELQQLAVAIPQKKKLEGKGGKGGKGKPSFERTRVLDRCTGVIEDWRGSTGWIVADIPMEHDKAALHGGRIYVHSKDCGGNIMANAMEVAFDVYEDETGLGAEEVTPM